MPSSLRSHQDQPGWQPSTQPVSYSLECCAIKQEIESSCMPCVGMTHETGIEALFHLNRLWC